MLSVKSLVVGSIDAREIRPDVNLSLKISFSRMIDNSNRRMGYVYALCDLEMNKYLSVVSDRCRRAWIFRERALLLAEFSRSDAIVSLLKSHRDAGPMIASQLKTLMAWPSVLFGLRY